MTHPYVLTIAGFDPCGGAGVLADCKTIEALGGTGLSVITALTVQNEREVRRVSWRSPDEIRADLECLADCYTPGAVKIGITANAAMLQGICNFVSRVWPLAAIVWDPVLHATAGHLFFDGALVNIPWQEIALVTPNRAELGWLTGEEDVTRALEELSQQVTVYATSCETGTDTILNRYRHKDSETRLLVHALSDHEKHGSGCVLSAAIATGLAAGKNRLEAIRSAEQYMSAFLLSTTGLLGRHGAYV